MAALDCVGTDEAVDVSLALVADRGRIVTIAAAQRAKDDGVHRDRRLAAGQSGLPRSVRADLVRLAGEGRLVVPIARMFPLSEAGPGHRDPDGSTPGGKFVLEA